MTVEIEDNSLTLESGQRDGDLDIAGGKAAAAAIALALQPVLVETRPQPNGRALAELQLLLVLGLEVVEGAAAGHQRREVEGRVLGVGRLLGRQLRRLRRLRRHLAAVGVEGLCRQSAHFHVAAAEAEWGLLVVAGAILVGRSDLLLPVGDMRKTLGC